MKKLFFALFSLFSLFFYARAEATIYWVATTGNDANSCSAISGRRDPGVYKRTIASGFTCLLAGDTLYLRGGIYNETIDSNNQTIPTGTSWTDAPVIASYSGETVVMNGSSGNPVVNLAHSYIKYVVFDGLVIDAINTGVGIGTFGLPHHVRFQNVEVKNAGAHGVHLAGGCGLSSCDTFFEFINVKVHNNGHTVDLDHGFYIETSGNLIDKSTIYSNAAFGVHIYNGYGNRASNNILRASVIHGNATISGGTGCGIILGSGDNNIAYNNIIRDHPGCGILVGVNSPSNTKVYNNTVYNNGLEAVDLYSGGSNTSVKNNIFYQNGGTIIDRGASGTIATNNYASDPSFLNSGSNDFHLQSGSAAIDAGATLTEVTTDFDGNVRPQGSAYDIGAYEWVAPR